MEKGSLERYLAKKATGIDKTKIHVPLYHTCIFSEARKYIEEKKIQLKPCDVFDGEELIYTFLGRAEYMGEVILEDILSKPIGFALKPDNISGIKRIYPFDTGAVTKGVYKGTFEPDDIEEVKKEYMLGAELPNAIALIKILYETDERYIEQDILDRTKVEFDLEGAEITNIFQLHDAIVKKSDSRRATIEVQVNEALELTSKTLCGILASAGTIANFSILRDLMNECGIPPKLTTDNIPPLKMQEQNKDLFGEFRKESKNISLRICQQKN